jgi:hypothetical protein
VFDQTRAVHKLADREREWLEYGALLHDAGVHISYERHHRHSYYLIMNGELRGFDPLEIEIIALLARYHRQATPKKSHDGYGGLKGTLRKTVRTLAAMLRLAEGLDRSHAQVVTALDVVPRGNAYLIRLRAAGDAELELWAAHRHGTELDACSAVAIDRPPSKPDARNAWSSLRRTRIASRISPRRTSIPENCVRGKARLRKTKFRWQSSLAQPPPKRRNEPAPGEGRRPRRRTLTPMTFSLLHATDSPTEGRHTSADRYTYRVRA